MAEEQKNRPSFSPARRWQIGFDVVLRTALVLAVVVMANFIGAKFYHRFYLSAQTRTELSPRTLDILHSLTNHVEVTLYYDTHDPENFYPDIVELLNVYRDHNKNISIHTVDYTRDPAEAMKVKEKFNLPARDLNNPNSPMAKDVIIFSSGERHDIVPGALIVGTKTMQMDPRDPDYDPNEKRPQFHKKPVIFNGEVLFTSKILALAHGQPLPAYFLQRHGESSLADDDLTGYRKFGLALAQNDIAVSYLDLMGAADVPPDCGLLIIAAPVKEFDAAEIQKIDRYLASGGKLLVLFTYLSRQHPTGLEGELQKWGVDVGADYVKDPQSSGNEDFIEVTSFNPQTFADPLMGEALEMVLPRPITAPQTATPVANAPQVNALAASSENSTLGDNRAARPRSYSLIASVEQKPATGTTNPHGTTRIVVAGDSLMFDNELIDAAANRDFLNYALNWLGDRDTLLSGIGPKPVSEFRLLLTSKQQRDLDWLLLGALPGGVLVIGWMVWLVRRK
ncbi:MAG TPA: Gldg family protein [Candidatus Sulfotelmatobacter sp.]|jgi:ABC-2 type transport system permease protein|nr:Gldg family protein [Candidatus Sulfotelmatobacter sp.]